MQRVCLPIDYSRVHLRCQHRLPTSDSADKEARSWKKMQKPWKKLQNIVRSIALAKQANADALTPLQRAYLALTARITQSQMSVILIFTQKSWKITISNCISDLRLQTLPHADAGARFFAPVSAFFCLQRAFLRSCVCFFAYKELFSALVSAILLATATGRIYLLAADKYNNRTRWNYGCTLLAQFCILASLGLLNGSLRQHVKCFIKCLDGSMPFFACRQRWQIKGLCLPIHIKNDVYRIIGSSIRFLRLIAG